MLSIYDQDDNWMSGSVTNYNKGQKYTVSLEKDKIYYAKISDSSAVGSIYNFYCKKDLVVYIHAMNTSVSDNNTVCDRREECAIPIRDLLNGYDYYDPIINTEADMTSTFVRNVDLTTGLVPLRSSIYIFRGHGSSNSTSGSTGVTYNTGTNFSMGNNSYLMAEHLYNFNTNTVIFDMTGNLFSAWIGCQTAKGESTIVKASILAGSACSLGFEKNIGTKAANKYTIKLFELINEGYKISDAVDKAHSGISFWFSGLGSSVILGNGDLILKPTVQRDYSTMNVDLQTQFMESNILDGYTFMYENTRGTLKRYVKLVNGYVTDDYIDVYYSEDTIKGYYKSKTTYDENALRLTANYNEVFSMEDDISMSTRVCESGIVYDEIISTNTYDQIHTYNGELIPVRFYVTLYTNEKEEKYLDIKAINIITKMEISEDIMYE